MIDSPILRKLKAEWTEEAAHDAVVRMIVAALVTRFGPRSLRPELAEIRDEKQLELLQVFAVTCASLAEFRSRLRGESS